MSKGEETRKGRAHSPRKHVFSVYKGACPVPMLCSLIWSQKKKKKGKCAASSLRYTWRLEKRDCCGCAQLGLELGPRVLSPANVQHHVVTRIYQPRKPCGKQNTPPPSISQEGMGGDGRGRHPGVAQGWFQHPSLHVTILGCSHPHSLALGH